MKPPYSAFNHRIVDLASDKSFVAVRHLANIREQRQLPDCFAPPIAHFRYAGGMISSLSATYIILTMTLRPAQLQDAQQIAEVHVATWRDAYRGIVPDSLLDSLSIEAWTELWQNRLTGIGKAINLVLVLDEKVIGWVAVGPARDSDCDPHRTQQVYRIYQRSEYWGQGQGKELYSAAEHQMCQSGAVDAILWVFRDNIRARRFYEAQGYVRDRSRSEQAYKGDPSMIEIRYRKILSSLIPRPAAATR